MRSKIYQAIQQKIPTETVTIETAVALLKGMTGRKFDETIEMHVRLGIDTKKSEQMVRGVVVLPAGAVKKPRIAVIARNTDEKTAAQEAGATIVGGEELIEEIRVSGIINADAVVATPSMMSKVAKIAKLLGPKGLMPNPKTGTVTADPAAVVKALLSGKMSFKMDQLGNIHLPVAKISWDTKKIMANIKAALEAIIAARPATARGQLLRSVTIKSTMSPGIRIVTK